MKKHILIFILSIFMLSFYYRVSLAQETFSICAIDPVTLQVGSAGASCVTVSVRTISDVHPGVGVIHTQALYLLVNQNYASTLMNMGLSPQQIIDSLILHDAQNDPRRRQYGIVDLISGGRTAGYTGDSCPVYKNHILGPTYTIQGNTLLGPQILDSMQARFLNTQGTLAQKLMAALQGAKVIGADTRCSTWQTSSKGAFLRVARPTDSLNNLMIDLNVVNTPFGRDPIDSLQTLFNMIGITPISSEIPKKFSLSQNYPNPFNPTTKIRFALPKSSFATLVVYDLLGREIEIRVNQRLNAGIYEADFDGMNYPSGIYYYKLFAGDFTETKKMVLVK